MPSVTQWIEQRNAVVQEIAGSVLILFTYPIFSRLAGPRCVSGESDRFGLGCDRLRPSRLVEIAADAGQITPAAVARFLLPGRFQTILFHANAVE